MHPASRRQIAQMLETFSLAPEVSAFDLGCLNHETGRMSFRKTWTAPEVRKAFGWLAARNATGSSCYIRPAEALGRTSWVLAGPLTRAGLGRLTAAPAMIVESSPGIFEAWLRLAAPVDAAARSAAARRFTREAGGDAGPVRAAQLGHLPGTTNRAPASAGDGPAFFAALRSRSPSAVTPIPRAVEPFIGRRRGRGAELAAAGEKTAGHRDDPDRSRRDFAIACRLLETGAGDHAIAAAIAATRGFDPQCVGAYIPRTIRAARLHLQHKEG
ncbi:MAG: DNA-primase RepB domain-containing protein [Acidobacteria bacterium]|nr:DNA-primase RepB domain-containing protein [Acidobacteriota bacterium]